MIFLDFYRRVISRMEMGCVAYFLWKEDTQPHVKKTLLFSEAEAVVGILRLLIYHCRGTTFLRF